MEKKKVLVIGGGFGGVFAAKALERQGRGKLDVELVNANNYFVFQPLLPEVAASSIHSADAVVPLAPAAAPAPGAPGRGHGHRLRPEEGDRRAGHAPRPDRPPLRRARHRARHRRRSEALPRPARARAHHEGPRRRAPAPHACDRLLGNRRRHRRSGRETATPDLRRGWRRLLGRRDGRRGARAGPPRAEILYEHQDRRDPLLSDRICQPHPADLPGRPRGIRDAALANSRHRGVDRRRHQIGDRLGASS